jgi:H+/Cl- antiporter ClcA
LIADITCSSFPIHHTHYKILFSATDTLSVIPLISFDVILLSKVIAVSVCFGLASYIFAELSHLIKDKSKQYIRISWLIPVIGGVLVLSISYALGTFDYLGLGVHSANEDGVSIVNSFHHGGAESFSWFWKLLLTAITLGMGFKGGEVTPLFFIGATLGNSLAELTGAPIDLFAGLGFIAVFAGATNTPIACTIMGIELFGSEYTIYYAVACFTAYYFSGHTGIYNSQRLAISKFHTSDPSEPTIKEVKSEKKKYGKMDV